MHECAQNSMKIKLSATNTVSSMNVAQHKSKENSKQSDSKPKYSHKHHATNMNGRVLQERRKKRTQNEKTE